MPRRPKSSAFEAPMPPRDTRTQALTITEALLHKRGYFGLSLKDVAAGIGVKKATLYHHFPGGKDELMMATAHRMLDVDAAGFAQAITSSETAYDRLLAVARWWFSEQRQTERMLREISRQIPEIHQREVFRAFEAQLYGQIRHVMVEGVARDDLPPHDTEFSAWMFMGLLSELGDVPQLAARKQVAEQMLELFWHGVDGRKPSSSVRRVAR